MKKFVPALVLIAIGTILILLLILAHDPKNPSDTIKNIVSILTCVIASSSLLFAVYTYNKTQKMRSIDRIKEVDEFWYRKIVLDRHLEPLLTLDTEGNKIVDTLMDIDNTFNHDSEEAREVHVKKFVVQPFNILLADVSGALQINVNVISADLSKRIMHSFSNLQDEFLKKLEDRHPNYDELKNIIINRRNEVLLALKRHNNKVH